MKIKILLWCSFLCFIMSCAPSTSKKTTNTSTTKSKHTTHTTSIDFMTNREFEMINELNLVRTNPKGYVTYVENYIKEQEALKKDLISGQEFIEDEIKTAKELIKILKKTPKMNTLTPHKAVYKAAKLHGRELNKTGKIEHQSVNGDMPWTRILRQSSELKDGSENLVGGPSNVRESVMVLLVDSGIPNRGHRKNILNPEWKYVACYEVGNVGDMPFCWVQNFAK